MIKQNDPRLKPVIRKIGCLVRSCGAVAEIKAGRELDAEQINCLWDWAKNSGNVGKDNCVKKSAPIINKALAALGCPGKFVEVATFRDGKMDWYLGVGEALKNSEKAYIQKVAADNEAGTHFRVVDFRGEILFDPYEPSPKAKKILYSIVYAYRG